MVRLIIDLAQIEHNTRLVAQALALHGMRLAGVTKACLGHQAVAGAMLAGGAVALADSRLSSLTNLRRFFPQVELELMRAIAAGEPLEEAADHYFVSSARQAEAMLRAAGRPLKFCLQVEVGDGREGVPPPAALDEAIAIGRLEGGTLAGLAANAACARPGVALEPVLSRLASLRRQLFQAWVREFGAAPAAGFLVSAGGSGLLKPLLGLGGAAPAAPLFAGLTELRCGEALLLGRIPTGGTDLFLPGAHRDAFIVEAPVLEVFVKEGVSQALIGIGIQDLGAGELTPCRSGLALGPVTSDYLVIKTRLPEDRLRPGDRLQFRLNYYALLAAMTSPFVEKRCLSSRGGSSCYSGGDSALSAQV